MTKRKPATAVAKVHEPTTRELAAQAAYRKRRDSQPPVPGIKVKNSQVDGKAHCAISIDHPDPELGWEILSEAIASNGGDFIRGTIDALAMLSQQGTQVNEKHMNYAASMVAGLKPRDQLEATLGVQMAAVHLATMQAAANMGGSRTHEVREVYERALNRLARTFAAQVQTLKQYRSKGEQRVIVERVTVEKGGQAIVGTVAHGGGVNEKDDA
ncbi:MAG: hypothetical protein EOR36_27390 [Mesorhizobium sp.]|nr:hypothetical protein [Mesorhizobium sp.]RWF84541.1 MAG: hypothetical protein EOQ36_25600 [Mesorhizobium sp.]RWI43512.1 MAG: hypothetical protein EOR14_02770 [Mesorhizobium sp.]RWI67962.1 MAG: hypothetical protein EOR17_14100 [Mesorhizobium sp.]RWI82939.1 MAG: hypothetical protein EOR20_25565 [Mesorhizobium sp.]RWJ12630.1 MAG: hypothetical protein EOR25_29510 [Mesorhizobium sp.]